MKNIILGIAAIALVSSCSLTRPYAVTNNSVGEKTGTSKTTIIFGMSSGTTLSTGIVTNKDFGVIEAAKAGGITKVGSVDVKTTNFLFFQKVEVIVTGE